MEANARLIEQAKSLEEITPVLKDVVSATRAMATGSETRTMNCAPCAGKWR